ncbi:MAG: hypothetical protein ABJC39_10290 [Chloroflexota bacterium]
MTGRPRLLSLATIGPSLTITIVVSGAMDLLLVRDGIAPPAIVIGAGLFNATTALLALTGALCSSLSDGDCSRRWTGVSTAPATTLHGSSRRLPAGFGTGST